MAIYKVPQDVEADDKLLGPFTFRQFIYLIIVCALCASAWWLARIFVLLIFIPAPLIILFATLALPIKKDQPMETYLAAVISFYLKPRNRFWMPGQNEHTITIAAPKQADKPRTNNISSEEVSHRLSFLANIIDSEGYAIYDQPSSSMNQEFLAEANSIVDIFDNTTSNQVNQILAKEKQEKRSEIIDQMRNAIQQSGFNTTTPTVNAPQNRIIQPLSQNNSTQPNQTTLNNLAHNSDYSVETIQKEANRITNQTTNATLSRDEVFVSLH